MNKQEIIEYFDLFSNHESDGLECFLSENGKDEVFQRLEDIDKNPLSKVQLNQLLIISGLTGITYDFFKYYWLTAPDTHTYNITLLDDFNEDFIGKEEIVSLGHLRYGLRRIYTDALLYFGNITNGFNHLNTKKEKDLVTFFEKRRFPTDIIKSRGKTLDFEEIPKLDRYLISEMACKTYDAPFDSDYNLEKFLTERYQSFTEANDTPAWIRDLLDRNYKPGKEKSIKRLKKHLEIEKGNTEIDEIEKNRDIDMGMDISATDIMNESIDNMSKIRMLVNAIRSRFQYAREKGLQNTIYYLSLVNDLDVYVATSMRNKTDFIEMAETCEKFFKDTKIKNLHLRYFDPTISAADGHEDKGLIECLMVRCAKALIYSAGIKESYGKDAEAAMALSSGKPVIFYCMDSNKADFYKKIHPLTKLIDFSTGVANGAMVTFSVIEVVELLHRIFHNNMQYSIEQPKKGYFRLVELSTGSAVRIQTNNELLSKSFWNYFDRFVKE